MHVDWLHMHFILNGNGICAASHIASLEVHDWQPKIDSSAYSKSWMCGTSVCTCAGIDISKENREPGSLAAKLQRPSIDAWSNVDLASEQNCDQHGPVLLEGYAKPTHTGAQQASISLLWRSSCKTVLRVFCPE